jgi:hypothetical protein
LVLAIPDFHAIRALQATFDTIPPNGVQPQLMLLGNGFGIQIDPSFAPIEMPQWPRRVFLAAKLSPNSSAVINDVKLSWMPQNVPPIAAPPAHTCTSSDVRWEKHNPMSFSLDATLQGRCTVVFRETFAPIWALQVRSGSARVLDHAQVDGFANGWTVEASGPVTFAIVNRALLPYVWGMVVTIASLLAALGFAIAGALRRVAARRSSRVPSPA